MGTPQANVLWDCLPLLDEPAVELVTALGGISALRLLGARSCSRYFSGQRAGAKSP